ncbi:hypothetical protein TRAPUB_5325 [Trametes pubescens]|uniref:F-box domain-containing protein n=1 Tax=Trametes pubescens TaxID=154538 RepID=A0A1M2V8Y2_TRAPU|nr:hypothetical protein TRAPUB_5325 [Trametes pubescens]
MENRPSDDTVTPEGPLYGLCLPDLDPDALNARILAIGTQVPSLQEASSDTGVLPVRALRNARRPIHKLPTEILVDMFLRQSSRPHPESAETSDSADWFQIMLVCRRWRAVVKANTCFWRSIKVGSDIRWLDLALSRSGDVNLSLTFSVPSALLSGLSQILGIRERIERLRFSCLGDSPSLKTLEPLVRATLPSLIDLGVSITRTRAVPAYAQAVPGFRDWPKRLETFELAPSNFPGMTKLSLKRVSLPWTASCISHLRHLDLRGCIVRPNAMSVSTFLDVLREGHNLEELILHDMLSSACPSRPRPSERLRAVALPRLRKAEFVDDFEWISLYVSYIQLPPQGEVSFTGLLDQFPGDDPSLSFAAILPRDAPPRAFLRSATSASLYIENGSYQITCQGAGPLVTLHLRGRSYYVDWLECVEDGVAHFIETLNKAPLTKLELAFECDSEGEFMDQELFDYVLDAFPRLQEIQLRSNVTGGDGGVDDVPVVLLCQSLGSRSSAASDSDGDVGVRCPNLKVLRVHQQQNGGESVLPALVECLFSREAGGGRDLELLAVTLRRSGAKDWTKSDMTHKAVFVPMVRSYEFTDAGQPE